MGPRGGEKSQLKRGRVSVGEGEDTMKKVRRSQRLSQTGPSTPISKKPLPSPITHKESTSSNDAYHEGTATPPEGRPSQIHHRTPDLPSPTLDASYSSPPQDTQPFSQIPYQYQNPAAIVDECDEDDEVWGYLFPMDAKYGKPLVLKSRHCCPNPKMMEDLSRKETERTKSGSRRKDALEQEQLYEETKLGKENAESAGYLIGRHPECDLLIDDPLVSNRHCLIYTEHRGGDTVAILEDLSSNGTFVNEAIVGRNKRREMKDQDEITILDKARFVFRYGRKRGNSGFMQQYTLLERLGKGHFAEVFLCVEKATGQRYAVKIFSRQPGIEERSKNEGLEQEIAVLMGVSHPNVLCLKDTYTEPNAVYVVLELAPEGELFNLIVLKQKLTEAETRKLFIQLFQGVKYLHDRNIVHRDIKPENILLIDKDLHVKLADFGLAKIIGEESFTTTLCGTPSYVAPEILEDSRHRRYTRAVDIWSLGVVLYICLCGFPPFSDELYTKENPYTLTQQIKMGRFDYPSPYWDSVGDPALDLIDRMLEVDVNKRYTIDQCLEHPWTTYIPPSLKDSTDGLVGGLANLDFSKRKMARERTLLSSINEVHVTRVVNVDSHQTPVKVFSKNAGAEKTSKKTNGGTTAPERGPAAGRQPGEFIEMGGKGDETLYRDADESCYATTDLTKKAPKKKKKAGR